MPVSGSVDYSVSASDIITCAGEDIQIIQNGETMDNADVTTCLRTLNLMTKEWMGKPGFAPGLKKWTRRTGYLFLVKNKNIYGLGTIANSGDYCCVGNYTQGTLTASAAGGAGTIAVTTMYASPTYTTATPPSTTDYIGIQLDSGDIQWTTLNGTPTLPGNITLTANLTSAATLGNYVFSFAITKQTQLPLDVLSCRRRDPTAGTAIDYEMDKMNDIYEYEAIANKNITSTPVMWYFEKGLALGNVYINCVPALITNVLRLILLYPIDDEDLVTDTMAFPQQCFAALEWGLAKKIAPKFGKSWTDTHEQNYQEAMAQFGLVDPDMTYSYFQPGRE
jgi:hypothetical protein